MPKIGNSVSSSQVPCDRCNSPRKVKRVWVEKIKSDHGEMILEHKEIVCTNKDCQKAFELVQQKETEKRAKLHQIKLDNAAQRANAKLAAS